MSEAPTWKDQLGDRIPEDFGREIDIFETEIELRKQDKIDEVLFAETRLRRGVYGQRYDNGQRFDGRQTQHLDYPEQKTKGPNTAWHAPGMVRIKVPFGGLDTTQMETLADYPPGHSTPLCPHRRHHRPPAPPRRRRHHHARGVRQLGTQRHRLPVGRRLQHRNI